jgi:hypothetical protein
MKNQTNWIIRNIIGAPINGYSQVTISNEDFNEVRGFNPQLPFTAQGDQAPNVSNGVRIFIKNNIALYASYDKEARKTTFIMKTEDAEKCLLTLTTERANEPKLPFNINAFRERNIVASI